MNGTPSAELGAGEQKIDGLPNGYKCYVSKIEDAYTKILDSDLKKSADSFIGMYQRTIWCEINGVHFETQAMCGNREGDFKILSFAKGKDKLTKLALLCNPDSK